MIIRPTPLQDTVEPALIGNFKERDPKKEMQLGRVDAFSGPPCHQDSSREGRGKWRINRDKLHSHFSFLWFGVNGLP